MCDLFLFLYFHSVVVVFHFFFFKQKTAYEMRISDWSSDVCSSDLLAHQRGAQPDLAAVQLAPAVAAAGAAHPATSRGSAAHRLRRAEQIGRASCRERVCQYV